jgi:glycosyltransferase involved in cell wall biosynthesis
MTIPKVAIIIPAYNEEARIARVLKAATASAYASEVIVVSDGSFDGTARVARQIPGVRVIDLPYNHGKGGAMAEGVRGTRAPFIAFVDADLDGLEGRHIDDIIRPILAHQCDMCVGIFRGGKVWSDTAQRVSPYLSGQRAMRRELFESIPYIEDLRMGVEIALNQAAKRRRARVLRVVLHGVSNCHKEQKLGFVKGLQARGKMYMEITGAMVKTHPRKRPNKRSFF